MAAIFNFLEPILQLSKCRDFSLSWMAVYSSFSARKNASLEKAHKKKMTDEEKLSGTNPEDLTNKEKALDVIIQRFADIEIASEQEKQKSATANAATDESPTSSSKRSRRFSDETLKYLRD